MRGLKRLMTVRWGILGCGDVCEVKSGPAFQKAAGSELVAVMRRDGARARDFAERHGVPAWYDDADRLLADPRVDAVYVAAPPGAHAELALRACAAGKPTYVEKPMARNTAECALMIDAFARAQLPLFVAYYRRSLPRFVKAKALIDAGSLGTVTGVSCHYASAAQLDLDRARLPWRLRAADAGGGLLLDLGSHSLDILDFLLGPLDVVSGQAANLASAGDVEDRVTLSFRTPQGALCTASWNFASAIREDLITITGTAGTLRLTTFGNDPIAYETRQGVEHFDLKNPIHIQGPLIQTIVDALHGQGTCPSSGASAARTSAVMDRALLGYYGSRETGFWETPERWPGRRRQ
jgi:predicted dehydrogenase